MEQVAQNQTFSPIPAGYATRSVAGAANITLATNEAASDLIELTGALTGNIVVTVPTQIFPQVIGTTPNVPYNIAYSWLKVVRNSTTGAFTVTLIGPGGTGVLLPQGQALVCYSRDGVNVQAGGAASGAVATTSAVAITAGIVRTQAGATPLIATMNRVDTSTAPAAGSTLGDGVLLPASVGGSVVQVINNTANPIQVYGAGADTINGVAAATGVPIPTGDAAFFLSAAPGAWQFEAGMGSSGNLPVELAVDNVTAAGATQATATQLVAALNRIVTATPLQGIRLPASAPGLDIIIENHTGVQIVVYGNGADTIDDVPAATGLQQMDSSVVIFTCYATGKWYTNGAATGYAKNPQGGVVLETMQYADGLAAIGATQATALQLSAAINTIATVPAGTGVNLPASAPGLSITIQNNGANPLQIYPAQGAADTINGIAAATGISLHAGTVGVFNCTAAGAWTVEPVSPVQATLNIVASVDAPMLLTAAQVTGAVAAVDTQISGGANLTAGRNLQLPTVATLVAALHAPTVGTSYRLRITNFQGGAFAFTVVTNAGWTLTGTTFTVAQNTWREFVVTLTTLTTATLKPVATGTFS